MNATRVDCGETDRCGDDGQDCRVESIGKCRVDWEWTVLSALTVAGHCLNLEDLLFSFSCYFSSPMSATLARPESPDNDRRPNHMLPESFVRCVLPWPDLAGVVYYLIVLSVSLRFLGAHEEKTVSCTSGWVDVGRLRIVVHSIVLVGPIGKKTMTRAANVPSAVECRQ